MVNPWTLLVHTSVKNLIALRFVSFDHAVYGHFEGGNDMNFRVIGPITTQHPWGGQMSTPDYAHILQYWPSGQYVIQRGATKDAWEITNEEFTSINLCLEVYKNAEKWLRVAESPYDVQQRLLEWDAMRESVR